MNKSPEPLSDETLLALTGTIAGGRDRRRRVLVARASRWRGTPAPPHGGTADATVEAIREPCGITAELSELSGLTSRPWWNGSSRAMR